MIGRWFRRMVDRLRRWLPGPAASIELKTAPLELPKELPEAVAELLREQRARLESGVLFEELTRAAAATGALVEAKISETGAGGGVEHELRIVGAPRRTGVGDSI